MEIKKATYNIPDEGYFITEGDTVDAQRFKDIVIDGNPADLTNAIVRYVIKNSYGVALYEAETGNGITNGTDFFVREAFTAPAAGDHRHEFQFDFTGDVVRTWITGTIKISKQIVG